MGITNTITAFRYNPFTGRQDDVTPAWERLQTSTTKTTQGAFAIFASATASFVSRCMGDSVMISEYPEQSQRAAVCNAQWKEYGFQEQQTYDVNDVEIFSSGKWNGDKYTDKDLDDMVSAFQELKSELKPYLKLGHDDKQQLLQKDGYPSAGWVTGLKRKGNKLLADFKGIPKKIKELIEKKAFGRFSSEIYWDLKTGDRKFRRVLKAVALLGGDTPAVSNLDDFINLYTENKIEYENLKEYHELEKDMEDKKYEFLEGKIKEYEKVIEAKEAAIKEYTDQINGLESDKKDLQEQVKELTNDIETKEHEQKEKDVKLFIDKAVEDKKILPSQANEYTELAESNFESVKKIVENMPELIDTDEKSHADEKPKKYEAMDDDEKEEFKIEKAYALMKEDKDLSFRAALETVEQELGE